MPTVQQLAKALRVSAPTVRTWRELGMPNGIAAARRWVRQTGKGAGVGRGGVRRGAGRRRGASGVCRGGVVRRLAVARTLDAEASGAKKTLAMRRMRGELVPVDAARGAWGRELQGIVDRLDAVPNKVGDALMTAFSLEDPAKRVAIVEVVERAIHRAREAAVQEIESWQT